MRADPIPTPERHRALYFRASIAIFVIVVAGMRAADTLLVPFLLSVFIAIISAPPLIWLQRRGLPSALALLTVISGVLAGGLLVVMVVSSSLAKFMQNLPQYRSKLQENIQGGLDWLHQIGIDQADQALTMFFNLDNLMNLIAETLTRLGGTLTNSFLIFLTTLFILLEAASLPTKLRAIYGESQAHFGKLDKFVNDIQHYMALKTLISLTTGGLVALWVALLGVDFPLLWGLLAFFLNYVPNIGSLIAAVPAIFLALVQLGTASAVYTALGYLLINGILGNVVEPRLMGRGLSLSTLVVFLSLVFWGWVLGPVGMLLSVPLTMTMKIVLEAYQETRWIAILLGSEDEAREALRTRDAA
jgi:predicted PurR-regulated permease PerM